MNFKNYWSLQDQTNLKNTKKQLHFIDILTSNVVKIGYEIYTQNIDLSLLFCCNKLKKYYL